MLVPGKPIADLPWMQDADETVRFRIDDRKVDVTYSTNSLGFVERQFGPQPPPGTVRVAVLGDSHAVCNQVPEESRWPRVLENALARRLGKPAEVLSFGVAPSWTAMQYEVMRRYVVDSHPDLVLLEIDTGDLPESVLEGTSWERYRGTLIHYRTEGGRQEAEGRVDKFHYGIKVPALRLSCLVRTVDTLLRGDNRVNVPVEGEPNGPRPSDEEARRRVGNWLGRIEALAAEHGIRVLIVWYTIDDPKAAPRLEEFARGHHCPQGNAAVDAGPWWRGEHADPVLLIPNDGHLNAEGCRRFGEWLAPRVESILRSLSGPAGAAPK